MSQLVARPASTIDSIAALFGTGSAPGSPRHTGHVCVLGSAPNSSLQPQNILVLSVVSSAWTSSCTPIGRPLSAPRPHGTLMPPLPAMLIDTVKISDRCISTGSPISPNSNAARGLVGTKITSHFS